MIISASILLVGLVSLGAAQIPCAEIEAMTGKSYVIDSLSADILRDEKNKTYGHVDMNILSPLDRGNILSCTSQSRFRYNNSLEAIATGNCTYPSSGRLGPVKTKFQYLGRTRGDTPIIEINQELTCISDDNRLVRPLSVSAQLGRRKDSEWMSNHLKNITCNADKTSCQITTGPDDIGPMAEPIISILTPWRNCTELSQTPTWTLDKFNLTRLNEVRNVMWEKPGIPNPKGTEYYDLEVHMENLDVIVYCQYGRNTRGPEDFPDPNVWGVCHAYGTATHLAGSVKDISLKINVDTWDLTLKHTWICEDSANGMGNFTGEASVQMPVQCNGKGNGTECLSNSRLDMTPSVTVASLLSKPTKA